MSESESTYRIQGSRVYGNGKSYNCNNIITAKELCNNLNELEKQATEYKEIEEKLDHITKTIIQVQLSIGILTKELTDLKELLE